MAYGLIGLYGIYLIFVGYRGNQSALFQAISQDGPGFVPWLIVVIVLGTAYRSDTLKPVVKPFIALALLAFVLKNYSTLKGQLEAVIGSVNKGTTTVSTSQAVTSTPVANQNQLSGIASSGVLTSLLSNPSIGGM